MASKSPIRDYVKGEWQASPPCVRRLQWLWLIPVVLLPLIAGAWMVRFWVQRAAVSELWVSVAIPLSISLPQFVAMFFLIRAGRRLRRAYAAAGGRLCTNCVHDLSGLDEVGKCPECGYEFDAAADGAAWRKCGVGK